MQSEEPKPVKPAPVRRFKKTLKREVFELEDPNGSITECYLQELSGPQREEFMGFMSGKMKMSSKGTAQGIRDLKGMHVGALSMGCFYADGRPIPGDEIISWPGSLQAELFELLSEMSGLNQQAKEDAKNA